ncbi:hypothetical protein FA95DRAFT_65983 [Auriscalpium vulgare]|uniref:Uncharacterized protein n=1 Tax=Auriscalpium vulgare TaxID=40419 RepID=A0ACB8S729_9AGAM|nr:hypothetical protein FA95DRAFT_65983 [Auriscalpium vulgare]
MAARPSYVGTGAGVLACCTASSSSQLLLSARLAIVPGPPASGQSMLQGVVRAGERCLCLCQHALAHDPLRLRWCTISIGGSRARALERSVAPGSLRDMKCAEYTYVEEEISAGDLLPENANALSDRGRVRWTNFIQRRRRCRGAGKSASSARPNHERGKADARLIGHEWSVTERKRYVRVCCTWVCRLCIHAAAKNRAWRSIPKVIDRCVPRRLEALRVPYVDRGVPARDVCLVQAVSEPRLLAM